jgi:hypothetical protein
VHRLAATIEAWWPAVEAAITTGYSNARSEGYNRLAKHQGRNAFGFRLSTLASVQGLRFAAAAWKIGSREAGTAKVSYSCFASSSGTALAKAHLKLIVGKGDGPVPVRGVA